MNKDFIAVVEFVLNNYLYVQHILTVTIIYEWLSMYLIIQHQKRLSTAEALQSMQDESTLL
jgi:hypothetical protein